jgi:hypothetical protein
MPQYQHAFAALLICTLTGKAAVFSKGDAVRLTRSETLMFNGKNFLGAPKGQEFRVLKHDAGRGQVFVAFYKGDGTLIAVSLPAEALEASPPDGWTDLLCGVEAFRDQRYEQSRRLLARAAQAADYRALAGTIAARTAGATNAVVLARANTPQGIQAFAATLQALRDVAVQMAKTGQL